MLPFIGMTLAVFIVAVALVAFYPAVRWSARAQWGKGEALLVLPPYAWWAGLFFSGAGAKSMSNLVAEPFILGLLIGVLACIRIWLAKPLGPKRAAIYCGIVAATAGGLVWWLMPGMRE